MVQIIPAILATTEEEYKEQIEHLWDSNEFDRDVIQVDLMDGQFVDNKSITPEIVLKHQASFKYEIHLMVKEPYEWVMQFKEFPKALRFILPIETDGYWLQESIGFIRAFTDAEIGFSFNPETPMTALTDELRPVAESLLIMSVNPGKQGQDFMPESLEKIKEATRLVKENGLDCLVGVDGGVSSENIKDLVEAGVDYVVMGSHLTKGDIHVNLESIWEALL